MAECPFNWYPENFTFAEWNSRLQAAFELHYYVPEDGSEDTKYHCNTALINKRGIYKVRIYIIVFIHAAVMGRYTHL